MSDQNEQSGPWLEDTEGNQMEIETDDAARAFRQATRNGTAGHSPPIDLWWSLNRPDGGVHLRVIDDDGRWVITDVYVHGRGLTATDLQAIPLTQLDLTMNLLGYWEGDQGIMDPDTITEVINEFATTAGYGPTVVHNLDDDAEEPSLAELRLRAADAPPELPKFPAAERPRLTRPDGTDPDGFAEKVAAAYREYVTQTRAPAVEIAKEADVPVGTVRGWIREARRRGKLPQGQKGKVG